MSELFLSNVSYAKFLHDAIYDKPSRAVFATYGIYAGFSYLGNDTTKKGKGHELMTRELLEMMRDLPDVRFLVGINHYRSCKGFNYCEDCEKSYIRQLFRIMNHADAFPTINWRISTELHLKCCLFDYDNMQSRGISGGRNFTDSKWADVSIELEQQNIEKLHEFVDDLWGKSRDITADTVSEILREEEICESNLHRIIPGIEGLKTPF